MKNQKKVKTEEQALVREIQDEIHCSAKVLKKLGEFKALAVFDDAIVKLSVYLAELTGEIYLDYSALEECKFISIKRFRN